MVTFDVPDMTCAHCVRSIETALRELDAGAEIAIDLPAKTVAITTKAGDARILAALQAAGYDGRRRSV